MLARVHSVKSELRLEDFYVLLFTRYRYRQIVIYTGTSFYEMTSRIIKLRNYSSSVHHLIKLRNKVGQIILS